MPPKDLVKVAIITGAHGIRGEVKLLPFVDDIKLLATQPLLDAAGRELFSITITGSAKGAVIAKLSTISDRNAAELLKGKELFAPALALPALDNEFYIDQLVGLKVKHENGADYGVIIAMHNFGAGDIMEIETVNGTEMLPFKAPWLGDIFMDEGYIIITPPEYTEVKADE